MNIINQIKIWHEWEYLKSIIDIKWYITTFKLVFAPFPTKYLTISIEFISIAIQRGHILISIECHDSMKNIKKREFYKITIDIKENELYKVNEYMKLKTIE